MALLDGSGLPGKAQVDANNNLYANSPGYNADGTARGGGSGQVGGISPYCETDPGTVTGAKVVVPLEADHDFRLRTLETLLDHEDLNYAAQNTGKYTYANTTMTVAWTASGMTTNSASITTVATGVRVRSYALFPLFTSAPLYCDIRAAFTAAMPTNTTIDFGHFGDSGANPFDPTDGVWFRFDSGGSYGFISNGGVISSVPLTGLVLGVSRYYKFTISLSAKRVEFFVDDVLYGTIQQPVGTVGPWLAAAQPFAVRHAITAGAASTAVQAKIANYQVTLGGFNIVSASGDLGARAWGSHQGLGGGTMGSLASYANSTTPAGVAGSNTAAAVTGLGGQVTLNAAAAAATDFILTSQQVPAGTAAVQGRRLVLRGVSISAANLGAAVATTETTLAFSLAFGHTAVSLATAEAATTKAPRREALGIMSWAIGAAIGSGPREGRIYVPFNTPIYVNPGEFLAVAVKFLQGTATASQTIYIHITYDYGWE